MILGVFRTGLGMVNLGTYNFLDFVEGKRGRTRTGYTHPQSVSQDHGYLVTDLVIPS